MLFAKQRAARKLWPHTLQKPYTNMYYVNASSKHGTFVSIPESPRHWCLCGNKDEMMVSCRLVRTEERTKLLSACCGQMPDTNSSNCVACVSWNVFGMCLARCSGPVVRRTHARTLQPNRLVYTTFVEHNQCALWQWQAATLVVGRGATKDDCIYDGPAILTAPAKRMLPAKLSILYE